MAVSEELYWVRTSNFGPPMLRPLVDLLAHGSLSLLLSPGCKTRKTATQRTSDVVLKKPSSASRKLATLTESVPHRRQAHVRVFVRASAFVHMACESLSLSSLLSLSLCIVRIYAFVAPGCLRRFNHPRTSQATCLSASSLTRTSRTHLRLRCLERPSKSPKQP